MEESSGSSWTTSGSRAHHFPVYEPPRWDKHKALIATLYKRMELKDVMRTMRDEHGFKASENQYKKQFAKWGFNTKHVKAKEYKAMMRIRKQRVYQGKRTEFFLRGHQVSDANINRFEDRMLRNGKISEGDTFSDIATPDDLVFRSPSPMESGDSESTSFTTPYRREEPRRIHTTGFEVYSYTSSSASSTSPSSLQEWSHLSDSSVSHFQPPVFECLPYTLDETELENEISHYSRLPESPEDQIELGNVISTSNFICDEHCSQCESFGYRAGAWGCFLHRCLAKLACELKDGDVSPARADMLCRGMIHNLLIVRKAPLASLLRVSTAIIWIMIQNGDYAGAARFSQLSNVPPCFVDKSLNQNLWRPLTVHAAVTLAQSNLCKEAILTIKSVLCRKIADLTDVVQSFARQELTASTVSFEQSISQLTDGRVKAYHNGSMWVFYDFDADQDHGDTKTWYRDECGELKREELFVRGIAVRSLVEVEWQRRREKLAAGFCV